MSYKGPILLFHSMLYTVSDLFISFDLVVSIYGSLLWEVHEHTLWGFLWLGTFFYILGLYFLFAYPFNSVLLLFL